MITQGEGVEIRALRKQGWSVSAIARHVGVDRKTVRAHLAGVREAGVRRSGAVDPFDAIDCRHVPRIWSLVPVARTTETYVRMTRYLLAPPYLPITQG